MLTDTEYSEAAKSSLRILEFDGVQFIMERESHTAILKTKEEVGPREVKETILNLKENSGLKDMNTLFIDSFCLTMDVIASFYEYVGISLVYTRPGLFLQLLDYYPQWWEGLPEEHLEKFFTDNKESVKYYVRKKCNLSNLPIATQRAFLKKVQSKEIQDLWFAEDSNRRKYFIVDYDSTKMFYPEETEYYAFENFASTSEFKDFADIKEECEGLGSSGEEPIHCKFGCKKYNLVGMLTNNPQITDELSMLNICCPYYKEID